MRHRPRILLVPWRLPLARRGCGWLAGFLIAVPSAQVLAQAGAQLPPSPGDVGEVRRGGDGKLMAVPAAEGGTASASGGVGAGPEKKVAPARTASAKHPRTIRVGPGEAVATIEQAARMAGDGDLVEILSGEYRRQPVVWTQRKLTIRGLGQRPVMVADGASAEGKAIWVIRNGDVTIENIAFRGARVADGNGAGIRFEKGHLHLRRCAFVDNEMGLLTGNAGDATLEIADSEFAEAPRHAGDLHHLLYVGAIGRFTLTGSRLQQGYRGHLVKSRARENHVAYNLIHDGPEGSASYELEFPNGGIAFVIGNVIGQGARTDNRTIVAYGAEGPRWPENGLYLIHNTLVNDHVSTDFLHAWTEKLPAGTEVWAINNLTVGFGTFAPTFRGRFEGNRSTTRAELADYGGLPLKLVGHSPLRGTAGLPGSVRGVSLLPVAEFTWPVGTRPLSTPAALAPGAFQ